MRKLYFILGFVICASFLITSCGDDDNSSTTSESTIDDTDTSYFAKGADVSWLTEMESNSMLFYDSTGTQTECLKLLKSLGMNAIRLRVWVNPSDGWCNKTDVLIKAKRASNLGLRIMIDFHYSDSWADPSQQTKPAAWEDSSFTGLCSAVSKHTTEILTALKSWGVTPEWVQVGNETSNGMLWNDGKASVSMANYATLNNAGYDAVKTVFPDAKVIIHLPNGQRNTLYRWMFDALKKNNAEWDVIGMSIYPTVSSWKSYNDSLFTNIKDMISRYSCPVMICETGMDYSEPSTTKSFLTDLVTRAKAISNENCLGVFYWEPEAYNGWESYTMGAFDNTGKPTIALDAFK